MYKTYPEHKNTLFSYFFKKIVLKKITGYYI